MKLRAGDLDNARLNSHHLPLVFEPIGEKAAEPTGFLGRARGYSVSVARHETTLSFPASGRRIRLRLLKTNSRAQLQGLEPLSGTVSYLLGNDPRAWRTGIPTYGKVSLSEIYPGIDLVYYGTEGELECDFVLRPGARPDAIQWEAVGADRTYLANGEVVLETAGQKVTLKVPRIYQEANGARREIGGRYRLDGSRISFAVDKYDPGQALIIDPVLKVTNTIGGSGSELATAIASDAAGNIYVAGTTTSADFPRTAILPTKVSTSRADVFIAKLDPSAQQLVYSVFFGGSETDSVSHIAVDTQGALYATGITASDDFPTTPGSYGSAIARRPAKYVVKLTPLGQQFGYSTILALSTGYDLTARGLAVNASGNAYICGMAGYGDWPVTAGAYRTSPGSGTENAFVAKLSSDGSRLLYGTFLPGSPNSVAVAPDESAWLTGGAWPADFSITPGMNYSAGDYSAFALRLDPTGSHATFGALMGGDGYSFGNDIALDAAGMVYLTGQSSGANPENPFPTTPGAAYREFHVNAGFLAKIDPLSKQLVFSSYIESGSLSLELERPHRVHPALDGTVWIAADGWSSVDLAESGRNDTLQTSEVVLLQFRSDASSLINTFAIPARNPVAAFHTGHLYLAGWEENTFHAPLTAGSQPVGPGRGYSDAPVVVVDLNVTGAPSLKLNAYYLLCDFLPDALGRYLPVSRTVSLSSTGAAIPFRVNVPHNSSYPWESSPISVSPEEGVTPAEITVTVDPTKLAPSPTQIRIVQTGATEAVTILPIIPLTAYPRFDVKTPDLFAQPGETVTGFTDVTAQLGTLWPLGSAQVPFKLIRRQPSSWLTFSAVEGVTPARLSVTASASGLSPGVYYEEIQIVGSGSPNTANVFFTVGPHLSWYPALSFTFPDASGKQTGTVHFDSVPSGVPITLSPQSVAVTVSPSSGTTPLDASVTVDATGLLPGQNYLYLRVAPADGVSRDYPIKVWVGPRTSWLSGMILQQGSPTPTRIAPGALIAVDVSNIAEIDISASGLPWPTTLGAYRVLINGVAMPISRIAGTGTHGLIYGQMPFATAPGTVTVQLQTADGKTLSAVTSDLVVPQRPAAMQFARTLDGNAVAPSNPVRKGELVTLRLTGQGAVQPAVPDGDVPRQGVICTPLVMPTARIAGIAAPVEYARLSWTDVGVLDVGIRVPDVAPGHHYLQVRQGESVLNGIYFLVSSEPRPPKINAGGIVSGAGFGGGFVAAGGILSIFGTDLAPSEAIADRTPLPITLAGITVNVEGYSAPLFFVSPTQINFQLPWEVLGKSRIAVSVNVNGVGSTAEMVSLGPWSPGIFYMNNQGQGAVTISATGEMAARLGFVPGFPSRPAHRGEFITIYCTGLGDVSTRPANGAATPLLPLSTTLQVPMVDIGGVQAKASFSGLAPGFVALYQVNVQVPSNAPAGDYVPLRLMFGETVSNSVYVSID